jgi:rhamnogalacturonan endolyase
VDFIIGQSREGTDWNYAQVNVLKNGQWVGTTWKVQFDLPQATKGGMATLSLALTSAHNAKLAIAINGVGIDHYITPADNAMIRAGIHGQYHLREIPFNATLLKPGRNVLTLQQNAGGNVQKSVMYDCLRLELDEQHPFNPATDKPHMVGGRDGENNAAAETEPAD